MSDSDHPASRPVPWATLIALLVGCGLFLPVVYFGYVKHRAPAMFIPESKAAEKLSADQAWQATPEARLDYLADLRSRQAKQLATYGWVDQKAGIVQLPIDRAMELVARQYGQKQP